MTTTAATSTECPTCDGTGRIDTTGFGPFTMELRALHIADPDNNRAEVEDEGSRCRTCEGTGRTSAPPSPGFTCDGCGATHVGEFSNGSWWKPAAWFSREDADGVQLACSRSCISKVAEATGKRATVLPW